MKIGVRMLFDSCGGSVKANRPLKDCFPGADELPQMYPSRLWAPTCAVIVLVSACSSGNSQGGLNAADAARADASEAGWVGDSRTADTADAKVDRGIDAADSAGGRDVAGERGDTGDTRDAAALDVPALRDTTGGDSSDEVVDAADAADSRDALNKLDGTRDTRDTPVLIDTSDAVAVKDTNKDTSKDAAVEAIPVDAAPDVRLPNSCLNPIEISMDNPHVDLALTTTGESHKFDLPCATGGSDLVLTFSPLKYELFYADTFGASWNTILHIGKSCPPGPEAADPTSGLVGCSNDACNTSQSQAAALLFNDRYYLYLSGANGESGDVTLHFQHAPVGSGPSSPLAAGTGSINGITSTADGYPPDVCEGPGPSNSFWWVTCPDYLGGSLAASTCTGTTFDTFLMLQSPRTNFVSCVDDTDPCGRQSSMKATVPPGAGLNVLTIAGGDPNASGPYLLTYTRP